jgi:hypothetical protein
MKWITGVELTLERAALCFALLIGVLACVLPLTGTFGPESALLLAVSLSPWAGALGARAALRAQGKSTPTLLFEALCTTASMLAVPLVLLALNGLRVNPCEPTSGLRFIALGPVLGCLLACLLGVLVASAVSARRWATLLAFALPLLELARAAYGFLSSPAIYAFGHFFGYFPGTFYDRRVDVPDAWVSHRVLSGLIAAGLWALLSAGREPQTGKLTGTRLRSHWGLVVVASALALTSTWMARRAHALQHSTSSDAIVEQLGLVVTSDRCRAVLPRETPRSVAHRIAEDCEFRISQIESLLGVREDQQVTAYFFRSAQEKRQLMGAGRVYIAKPWRREVYLQLAEYPHPVLAHELAHVVARHASRGLFGVPGRLFGLIPEPTLVEGMAVALEPHARDELTPHQWAKAAYGAKFAPSLTQLLGVDFFGTNQALAYTLAGSFLRFVLESRGAAAVRRVYELGSVEAALGSPLPKLEQAWRKYLESVPLPARAAALAQQRFERPGVFSQVCPHLVERLEGELGAALGAGDLTRAIGKCREVLTVDRNDTSTRATLISALARQGDTEAARRELTALRGPPSAPTPTIARARTALADASFARGELARAEAEYRALLEQPQSDGELRQLEVKLLAVTAAEPGRALLRELLVSDGFRNTESRTAMHLIRELAGTRDDGLALYLEARQLSAAERPDLAQALLRDALARGLPSERLRVEALRLQTQAAFMMGSLAEAFALASELAQREGASRAEQLEAQDWQARIAFRRAHH